MAIVHTVRWMPLNLFSRLGDVPVCAQVETRRGANTFAAHKHSQTEADVSHLGAKVPVRKRGQYRGKCPMVALHSALNTQ